MTVMLTFRPQFRPGITVIVTLNRPAEYAHFDASTKTLIVLTDAGVYRIAIPSRPQ